MFRAEDRTVRVVVEHREFRTPEHDDLRLGREQHAHRAAEALRPRVSGTERRLPPVQVAHPSAHLAPALQERQVGCVRGQLLWHTGIIPNGPRSNRRGSRATRRQNSSSLRHILGTWARLTTGSPFPIVGVGASAGGIDALTRLLAALPRESGLALVVVQHLDPHHESQLSAILKARSSMKVDDATHGLKVEPNHVYVIQPNTNVAIADGVLSVTPRPDDRRPHYPIDHFLRSLAAVQGRHAVGVILSGTGSDGTLGLCGDQGGRRRDVRAGRSERAASPACRRAPSPAAPWIWCCRPKTSPRSSPSFRRIRTCADLGRGAPGAATGDEFHEVIAALHHVSGVDFSQYRDTTIKRRTARRMLLRGFKSPRDYAQFLERDARRGGRAVSRRADQRHQLLSRSGDVRGAQARRLPGDRRGKRPVAARFASGCRAARPARRRTRSPSPCSSSSTATKHAARDSDLRDRSGRSRGARQGPRRPLSGEHRGRRSVPSGSARSSPRRTAAIASRRACATSACSRGRTSPSIRRSRASI